MPRADQQGIKALHLLRVLNSHSDDENLLSMSEIQGLLEENGVSAERKSVYSYIEGLRQFGIDVICSRGHNRGYYIGERDFELAELKLLVDSVQASKFITKKKTEALIKKLEALTSIHYGKQLRRQVYIADRVKATNETVYYNVDKLHTAISNDVKVAFKYYEYTPDKKMQP